MPYPVVLQRTAVVISAGLVIECTLGAKYLIRPLVPLLPPAFPTVFVGQVAVAACSVLVARAWRKRFIDRRLRVYNALSDRLNEVLKANRNL